MHKVSEATLTGSRSCYKGLTVIVFGVLLGSPQVSLSQPSQSPNGPAPADFARLGRNTPRPVLSRAAIFVAHHDTAQVLRLVLGLKHPHMIEEEQFLKELQDRSSPNFHRFLTADQ